MSKRKRNESSRNDEMYVAKKNGKFHIFAAILCVLIAFVIWLYASNLEKKQKEETGLNVVAQASSVVLPTVSL